MDKKQKEERRHQEDVALNKGLVWVGAAIVLEVLLLLVKRFYIDADLSDMGVNVMLALDSALRGMRLVLPAAAVLCAVWAVLWFKNGKKVILPVALAAALGAVGICAHVVVRFQASGMQMLFLLVAAWAGLALVYYLYQKEFFLSASAVGMSVLGLWMVRYGVGFGLETVLVLAGILVVLAVSLWLKKNEGALRVGTRSAQAVPKGADYRVTAVSCLASLAAVLAALVLGSTVAYYLIFAMVAWLSALLVYYTVKMM